MIILECHLPIGYMCNCDYVGDLILMIYYVYRGMFLQ